MANGKRVKVVYFNSTLADLVETAAFVQRVSVSKWLTEAALFQLANRASTDISRLAACRETEPAKEA